MRKSILLLFGFVACSAQEMREDEPDPVADSIVAASPQFVHPDELPEMPGFPDGDAGRLRVVSSGETDLSNDGAANAGLCRAPAMLILYASAAGREEGESWGVILLLQVPPEGEREVVYPVAHVDAGFPAPPASTMALQITSGTGGIAFQALQGFVRVSSFDELITGQLQITVREINSEELIQVAGTFQDVSIHQIDDAECGAAAMLGG